MKRTTQIAIITGAACGMAGIIAGAQLGSLLKGGAMVTVVNKFGPDINKAVNKVLGEKGATTTSETKVVPILSLGDSGYIGAVQVAGPKKLVEKVKGVVQLEGRFPIPLVKTIRLKGLVPVDTDSPQKGFARIEGVGVSAIVDIKL